MLVTRDERAKVEGAVGAQRAQGLIGEGKGKRRGDIWLCGDGKEGWEGAEKDLGWETGVSTSETDGWHGERRWDPGRGWDPRK
jgi:hypothetical protein